MKPILTVNNCSESKGEQSLREIIQNDSLRQLERQRKALAEKTIVKAAKIIAPCIEETFGQGFDWCVTQVKQSQYIELANDLEIHKALTYLKVNYYLLIVRSSQKCRGI